MEEFEKSVHMYQQAIALAPDDFEVWGMLGDAQRFYSSEEAQFKPSYLRAIQLAEERLKINPSDVYALALLGHYHASLGHRELALEYIARAQEAGPKNMYVLYPCATALAILGLPDKAVEALTRAVEFGYPVELARIDAGFRELRQTPRFQQLVDVEPATKTEAEE